MQRALNISPNFEKREFYDSLWPAIRKTRMPLGGDTMTRVFIAFVMLAVNTVAIAATIDFEELSGPFNSFIPGPVTSKDFTFSGSGNPNPVVVGNLQSNFNGNFLGYCSSCELTMAADSGSAFSMLSAEIVTFAEDTIDIVGYYSQGGTIQISVTSTAPVTGIVFDSGWTNLSSVSFGPSSIGATAGITTVVADVVPIPAAVWLFVSGLGLLGWLNRRRAGL
jgi:hypothetical protein